MLLCKSLSEKAIQLFINKLIAILIFLRYGMGRMRNPHDGNKERTNAKNTFVCYRYVKAFALGTRSQPCLAFPARSPAPALTRSRPLPS